MSLTHSNFIAVHSHHAKLFQRTAAAVKCVAHHFVIRVSTHVRIHIVTYWDNGSQHLGYEQELHTQFLRAYFYLASPKQRVICTDVNKVLLTAVSCIV